MKLQWNYNQITDYRCFWLSRQSESQRWSYLNNGYEIMNYFAKFEKFLPHRIIIPSFITVRNQMPELDGEAFSSPLPPYKLGSQNTP